MKYFHFYVGILNPTACSFGLFARFRGVFQVFSATNQTLTIVECERNHLKHAVHNNSVVVVTLFNLRNPYENYLRGGLWVIQHTTDPFFENRHYRSYIKKHNRSLTDVINDI